ncbi:MAG: aldo/keto reductase, partial [Flavobacteriales bacterium]|nr:aldo/keto reductase [Flavobacteriales bacterium]
MKYTTIPQTDIKVSKICLGTMTYGQQNTEPEAHEQLNYAVDQGINFIDTAEMYSIPGRKETQGSTERYIGTWLKDQKREDLVVATKITGP